MIAEYIRYRVDEGRRDAFVAAYEAAAGPLMDSPHALAFDMARCVEDPSRFVLRIEWDSAEGHMKGFRGSAQFRDFLAHVRPYVDDIEEMRHYEPLLSRP